MRLFGPAFDEIFTTYFSNVHSPENSVNSIGFSYSSEVKGEKLVLTCDLPGVKLSDLHVTHESGGVILIEATRKGHTSKGRFTISSNYDVTNPKAILSDGVLELTFSKVKAS